MCATVAVNRWCTTLPGGQDRCDIWGPCTVYYIVSSTDMSFF